MKLLGYTEVEAIPNSSVSESTRSKGISESPMSQDRLSQCGACRYEACVGRQCKHSTEEANSEGMNAYHGKENSSETCSDSGECVCGHCTCKKRDNTDEIYFTRCWVCNNLNSDNPMASFVEATCVCSDWTCECYSNYTSVCVTVLCTLLHAQLCMGRSAMAGHLCYVCPQDSRADL